MLQPSKITEINDCDSEQSGYFNEEKYSPNESEESQAQHFDAKELSQSSESGKELVPNSELYERAVQDKQCDSETSQMINDEQNNNVQKSQIKSEPFNYQKFTASEVGILRGLFLQAYSVELYILRVFSSQI